MLNPNREILNHRLRLKLKLPVLHPLMEERGVPRMTRLKLRAPPPHPLPNLRLPMPNPVAKLVPVPKESSTMDSAPKAEAPAAESGNVGSVEPVATSPVAAEARYG